MPASAQSPVAEESHDWGVAPQMSIRRPPYSAPTPMVVPGARTVTTRTLQSMLAPGVASLPILIDVAAGEGHVTLPGSIWLPDAGRGTSFVDPLQADFVALLAKLTLGDKTRSLVFFCVNARCWLSYNAALRAQAAGYTAIYWYRGGIEAWNAADLPLVPLANPKAAGSNAPVAAGRGTSGSQ